MEQKRPPPPAFRFLTHLEFAKLPQEEKQKYIERAMQELRDIRRTPSCREALAAGVTWPLLWRIARASARGAETA